MREAFAESLAAPSEDVPDKTRLQRIVEAVVRKAERGNLHAVDLILDRLGGKAVQMLQAETEKRERIVIQWGGPPPPWAPKPMLDDYAKRNALPAAREPQTIEVEAPAPVERNPVSDDELPPGWVRAQ
jgi:hypothetical protein